MSSATASSSTSLGALDLLTRLKRGSRPSGGADQRRTGHHRHAGGRRAGVAPCVIEAAGWSAPGLVGEPSATQCRFSACAIASSSMSAAGPPASPSSATGPIVRGRQTDRRPPPARHRRRARCRSPETPRHSSGAGRAGQLFPIVRPVLREGRDDHRAQCPRSGPAAIHPSAAPSPSCTSPRWSPRSPAVRPSSLAHPMSRRWASPAAPPLKGTP